MKVDIETVVKLMLELFNDDEPCNFNDIDEFMFEKAKDWCVEHCGNTTATTEDCWRKCIELKLAELEKEQDAER